METPVTPTPGSALRTPGDRPPESAADESRPHRSLPAPVANPAQPPAEPAAATQRSVAGVVVLHGEVPGRLRLRVEGLKRSAACKRSLEDGLPAVPGVRCCQASIWTGTVLVHFDPDTPIERVIAAVARTAPAAAANSGPGPGPGPWAGAARPDRERRRRSDEQRGRRVAPATPPALPGQAGPPWHTWDGDAVLRRFEADLSHGLTAEAAAERLRRCGPNAQPPPVRPSRFALLLEQFATWPVGLLAVSAAVSVATGGIIDAIAIMGIVAINAGIGYVTETQTERTIRSLAGPTSYPIKVRRDGDVREVDVASVVPGDILVLQPGGRVAADARIVMARNLSIDESALTGESVPADKLPARLERADAPLGDRHNMAYRGTVTTGGFGLAVTVATGPHTEISQVERLAGETEAPQTPMQRQLGRLGTQLALLSGGVCAGVFVLGLLRSFGLVQMLKESIALAVAAVPEGLPAMATTTLALGIRDMRRHGVLIRRLDAIETLGAIEVLCLDKTGTLTRNRMTVVAIHAGMARYRVDDGHIEPEHGASQGGPGAVHRLIEIAALCNEAELVEGPEGPVVAGSATEGALVRLALDTGVDVASLRRSLPRRRISYRAEGRRFMSTSHALDDGRVLVAVKGSPQEVLDRCQIHARGGEHCPLTADDREAIARANEHMAQQALRVLGCAFAEVAAADDGEHEPDELVWLGLIGMADPVRPGVREVIGEFQRAGIDTMMITGDQSATAYAIARDLDLSQGRSVEILDSADLERIDPEVLKALAVRANVFARVTPFHKLRIVQALQRGGRVVAMTGDGINDGPALKAADVGVAMGRGGTDVARDIADVVLEDDDLATMATAIARGRSIYGNTRKAIHFLLATNLSEILMVLGATALGVGQVLSPMQLLWINLISDVFPALALALEPPEPDIMRQPPRDPDEQILSSKDFRRLGVEATVLTAGPLAAYGLAAARYGPGPLAGTIAFNSLVTAQMLHAVTSRSEYHTILFDRERLPPNPYLRTALLGSFAAQGAVLTLPPLQRLLGTVPLGPADLALTAGAGVLPFAVNELIRVWRRQRTGSHQSAGRPHDDRPDQHPDGGNGDPGEGE